MCTIERALSHSAAATAATTDIVDIDCADAKAIGSPKCARPISTMGGRVTVAVTSPMVSGRRHPFFLT